jgi:hypothetical protein
MRIQKVLIQYRTGIFMLIRNILDHIPRYQVKSTIQQEKEQHVPYKNAIEIC